MIWKVEQLNEQTFEIVDIDSRETICVSPEVRLLNCVVNKHNEVIDSLVCNIKGVSE